MTHTVQNNSWENTTLKLLLASLGTDESSETQQRVMCYCRQRAELSCLFFIDHWLHLCRVAQHLGLYTTVVNKMLACQIQHTKTAIANLLQTKSRRILMIIIRFRWTLLYVLPLQSYQVIASAVISCYNRLGSICDPCPQPIYIVICIVEANCKEIQLYLY